MGVITIIINSVILLAVFTIAYFLRDLPKLYRELKVEQTKATNNMELQREAYFREIGGKDLSRLLNDWTKMLYDTDRAVKNFKDKQAIDLVSRTVIYGSTKTINLCAGYMKHVFSTDTANESCDEDANLSCESWKNILYFAHIVSSLKFDFTGYDIDPIRLLEIKINDFSEHRHSESFERALEDIKREGLMR